MMGCLPLKKHLAELLRGIDVEFSARLLIDLIAQSVDRARETVAKGAESHSVHHKAGVLHFSKHSAQRKLNLIIQLIHLKLFELFFGDGLEPVYRLGAAKLRAAVAHGHTMQVIIALGRVEQVRRQRCIVYKAATSAP